MATTFSRSKFGPDEPRRTPTNSDELRSRVISEIWFPFFSWLVLTYHKEKHSAWMPKFLPSCYQQGRGQGHTLCSRNPLFPTNHVAREKSQLNPIIIPLQSHYNPIKSQQIPLTTHDSWYEIPMNCQGCPPSDQDYKRVIYYMCFGLPYGNIWAQYLEFYSRLGVAFFFFMFPSPGNWMSSLIL